jgi:AraC family transcriptional regulator of adaptative response/methylated-DNA-[protein]-cysteine methyltransferase
MKAAQQSLFDNDPYLTDPKLIPADFITIFEINTEAPAQSGDFEIHYSFRDSTFGELLIASTHKGICFVWFVNDKASAIAELETRFPSAQLKLKSTQEHQDVMCFFNHDTTKWPKINLHLQGTEFQLKVWKALLNIPFGTSTNYISIATEIEKPKASRAVGTAIGKNPIAYIIPCHRVVQTNRQLGGYMWGIDRKAAILRWEQEK